MNGFKLLLPLIIVLMVLITPVHAIAITFDFTGTIDKPVTDLAGVLGGTVSLGDTFSGSFSYDLSTPDTSTLATVGDYWHNSAPYGISIDINSRNFRTDSADVNVIAEVVNDHAGWDAFNLVSYNNIGADIISWNLEDTTMTAVNDTALFTNFNLASWTQGFGLRITGGTGSTATFPYFLIAGTVTSVTPASVPEPAVILLLVSPLVWLGFVRRRALFGELRQ